MTIYANHFYSAILVQLLFALGVVPGETRIAEHDNSEYGERV